MQMIEKLKLLVTICLLLWFCTCFTFLFQLHEPLINSPHPTPTPVNFSTLNCSPGIEVETPEKTTAASQSYP
jgi:hypothetical protein